MTHRWSKVEKPIGQRLPDGWGHTEERQNPECEEVIQELAVGEDGRMVMNKDELKFTRVQITNVSTESHTAPEYANFSVRLLNSKNDIIDKHFTHTKQEAHDLIIVSIENQDHKLPYDKFSKDVCDLIDLYADKDMQRDHFIQELQEFVETWQESRAVTGGLWEGDERAWKNDINPYKQNLIDQYIDKDTEELG